MSIHDETYATLLDRIIFEGEQRTDRTGVGTIALFGTRMRFDLSKGFPLLTTKRVYWKGVVEELLWFLRGSTNAKELQEKGVHIWDAWADEDGELGRIYGRQWRAWEGREGFIDQIENVVDALVENPDSRRHIVTAWNPADVDNVALPPCHCLFQFDVTADDRLNCQLYQRSADMFLGVPFNIASYSLLTMMVAHVTGLKPGTFTWVGGNTHIYLNHIDQVNEQLLRDPRPAPTVKLNPQVHNISFFDFEDIELVGYDPHPAIVAEVAV